MLVKRFVPYRSHVIEQLKANVTALRDVRPHVGNFSIEAIQRFSTLLPSASVSFYGMKSVKRNNVGQMIGPATTGIFVVDKDPLVGQVYGPVIDLAEEIADFIDMNQFGLDYAAAAIVKEIEPVYSEALDEIGISMMAITFEQEIQIGRSKHDVDNAAIDPRWGDPNFVKAGWPGDLITNAQSALGVPNVFGDKPAPTAGEPSVDDPDLY